MFEVSLTSSRNKVVEEICMTSGRDVASDVRSSGPRVKNCYPLGSKMALEPAYVYTDLQICRFLDYSGLRI